MSNALILGGVSSASYGIILTEAPPRIVPERDTESVSVAGRNGDLTIDNNRYKNVTLPCSCAILPPKGKTLRQAVTDALPFLTPTAGYKRLETTYDDSYYMEARITGPINVDSIVEQAGTFQLKLDCKPHRFLVSGEAPVRAVSGEVFPNPTLESAVPLLRVAGTISGGVRIGELHILVLFNSHTVTDEIWIDCDSQEAWRVTDGVIVSANKSLSTAEFPRIEPGGSIITITGGVDVVEVTPRWWTV